MQSTKSVDLIGRKKFLLWRQLDDQILFLSAKGLACETIWVGWQLQATSSSVMISLSGKTCSMQTGSFEENESVCASREMRSKCGHRDAMGQEGDASSEGEVGYRHETCRRFIDLLYGNYL